MPELVTLEQGAIILVVAGAVLGALALVVVFRYGATPPAPPTGRDADNDQ